MRFEDLLIFVTVSNMNSMTKASEELHLTKQTITSRIKALEEELGKQLFQRSRKGCLLTADGVEVYTTTKKILDLTDSLYYKDNDKTFGNKDYLYEINFIMLPSFLYYYEKLAEQIQKQYPKNNIYVNIVDAFYINNMLKTTTIEDYVIMTSFTEQQLYMYKEILEHYDCYTLYKSRLKLVAEQSTALASKKQVSIYSLEKYPFTFYSASGKQNESFYSDLLKSYGVDIKSSLLSNSEEFISKNILEKSFYSFSSDIGYKKKDFPKKLRFIPITPRIEIYYVALFPKNAVLEVKICNNIFLELFNKEIMR